MENYKKNFSIDSKKDLERVKKMYQNLNNFYTPTEKIIKTFKMKSDNHRHICGVKQKILFRYNKKPSAEKNYNIIEKYNRVFYQCEANHIWAKHYFRLKISTTKLIWT